jgi:hypothetical protein
MDITIKFHKVVNINDLSSYIDDVTHYLFESLPDREREQILLRTAIRKEIPQQGGVYFLMKGGTVFYVGRSINIQNRILNHAYNGMLDDADEIALQIIDDLPMQYVVEAVAIAEYLPELNKLGKTV